MINSSSVPHHNGEMETLRVHYLGCYGPLASNFMVRVQGIYSWGIEAAGDYCKGGHSGQEEDGPGHISVSDGF